MNNPTKEKVARLNKCDPSEVHCDNCFYLSAHAPFCCYHNCSLLNKDQACYKFKKKVK